MTVDGASHGDRGGLTLSQNPVQGRLGRQHERPVRKTAVARQSRENGAFRDGRQHCSEQDLRVTLAVCKA